MELFTPRLALREFRPSDFDAVHAYETNPETRRYEQVAIATAEETRRYLDDSQAWAQEQPRTRYRLAITIRPAGAAHGRISLALNWPEIREWEVGWTVDPQFWGHGYATEAARAAVRFGFEDVGLDEIVSFTVPANARSRAVMERLGITRDPADDFDHPRLPVGHPIRRHVLYRLRREGWLARG